MTKVTQSDVDEALDNAVDNTCSGEMLGEPIRVAVDMVDCCDTFEDEEPEELVPMVEDWQRRYREQMSRQT